MLIMAPSGDLVNFKLQGHSLNYDLRLIGYEVDNALTFQVHMASPQNIHLCILDTGHSLTYYRYHQNRWRKVHTWAGVSPAYQSILRGEHEMHVVIHFDGIHRHYIFASNERHNLEIPCQHPQCNPYRLFLLEDNALVLIHEETHETATRFFAQVFSLKERHWEPEQFLGSIPKNCRKLQNWLCRDVLYLGYFLPQGNTQALCLLVFDPAQGLCQEERFPGFSPVAGEPVLTLYRDELILLVVEPNVLVCRRSGDGGKTWPTKMEMPCPWPLKLAPVLNHRQEITPYVSVEGVYNLSFRQPAVVKAEELLTLTPYMY